MNPVENKIVEVQRLNEILDGASQLPLECQEHVLAVIRGMLFTKEIMKKEENKKQ